MSAAGVDPLIPSVGPAKRARSRGTGPPGAQPYSSMPFTFPSARRFSMIFCARCGGTGS